METAYIKSPLGITQIIGDADGISFITVLDIEIPISTEIPLVLKEAVLQLQEYFEGGKNRIHLQMQSERH